MGLVAGRRVCKVWSVCHAVKLHCLSGNGQAGLRLTDLYCKALQFIGATVLIFADDIAVPNWCRHVT